MAAAVLLGLIGLALIGKGLYMHAKAGLAQILLESAFAESLATGQPVKAWSWADTWPVARLEVPRLGASAIILKGGSGEALAFGPGLLDGTPAPGERGTSVIAAHRDTHFTFLRDIRNGDMLRVTRADGVIVWFRITATDVVPWNASGIDAQADGYGLVLSTCWPLDAVTHGDQRYIVKAQMVGRQLSQSPAPGAPL
ncbi:MULTISPECIES: class GN sortase [Rhodomicrobium]|uniref:class GN sortase n=1 Tax=Rhodomicrobium TaxID=1068 RepID=UPI001FD9F9DE|nr:MULTISPECIES: class GN sortase [Rhodomicrobium]